MVPRIRPRLVTFADPAKAVTTATFSAPGDYVIKLTAKNGAATASSTLVCKAVLPPPAQQLDAVNTLNFKVDNPLWNDRANR